MNKKKFIHAISLAYESRYMYEERNEVVSTRKTRNCAYRLLNILFSEEFAGEFATIGDAGTRAELDAGSASNNRGFWKKVEAAFLRKHEVFDKIQFPNDPHLIGMTPRIDPASNVQSHD